MNRSACLVVALVAAQAALIGVYWFVENRRSPDGGPRSNLGTAPPEPIAGTIRPLSLTGHDGSGLEPRDTVRPTLVHFWATWCPPCRLELPALLALPDEHPVDVVAIALDEDWSTVERFLDERHLSNVYLGDPVAIQAALGARSLPVTYLVQPGGKLRLRFDGARNWANREFLKDWMEDVGIE